jgi:glycosyltransferase involved in cell wall biosynthesis
VTDGTRIVGLSLVRDEEVFVELVLRNALALCDRILVADHGSRDRTPEILASLSRDEPRIEVHEVGHPAEAHRLVEGFAGEDVWVFGVDGDEVYDPGRLAELRRRLVAGEFGEWWSISGNALHCVELDVQAGLARGFLAPPARGLTKLYNFSAVEEWRGATLERLHGGTVRFRAGYTGDARYMRMFYEDGWDDSLLRCLHMAFVRRSSRDKKVGVRPNPVDLAELGSFRNRIRSALPPKRVPRKMMGYAKGDLVTVSVHPFFDGTA